MGAKQAQLWSGGDRMKDQDNTAEPQHRCE